MTRNKNMQRPAGGKKKGNGLDPYVGVRDKDRLLPLSDGSESLATGTRAGLREGSPEGT